MPPVAQEAKPGKALCRMRALSKRRRMCTFTALLLSGIYVPLKSRDVKLQWQTAAIFDYSLERVRQLRTVTAKQ